MSGFLLLMAFLWGVFFLLHRAVPFTRPGHELIYALAQDTVREGTVFPDSASGVRVAIFGDSRVQAGFKPRVFDEASGGLVYSYNLGLPNERRFVNELATLVRRGQAPDVVLLTNPWETVAEPTGFARFGDDRYLLEQLFPFRPLIRNVTLFLLRSVARGGPVAYARQAMENLASARRDRGYFFIEGMSHFPGHRLPDDFRVDGDDESKVEPREIEPRGPLFQTLLQLRREAGLRIVFVPTYFREHARRPVSPNEAERAELAPHGIDVYGPDYWLYPNRLFSDPGHLNREGAEIYTLDLWQLLSPLMREVAGARPPARD